ncbi:MAG: HEAT repeat domain-containing protein [Planctomycetota bacterium]|nr:HEAT repeat domain-containing protein [Planctomycetota bacterium]
MNSKTSRLFCVALTGLLVFGMFPIEAQTSREEWNQIQKQFQRKYASSDLNDKIEAVRILGRSNDARAIKIFINLLNQKSLDSAIQAEIFKQLSNFSSDESVEALVKGVQKQVRDRSVRLRLLQAVGGLKHPEVESMLLKEADSRDPLVQAAAIDALGKMGSEKAIPLLAEQFDSKYWQVKVAAIWALARIKKAGSVTALITGLGKEKGRLTEDIEEALYALTGKRFGDNAALWESWWGVNKSKPNSLAGPGVEGLHKKAQKSKKQAAAGGESGDESEVPTYYGIKIKSKRMVFVIDISSSMLGPLTRKPKGPQSVISGGGKGSKNEIDWSQIKTKFDLAKAQLIKAIKALKSDQYFNIVYYETNISSWKKGLQRATPGNKAAAIKSIEKLVSTGTTNIHGAFEKAFFISTGAGGKGKNPNDNATIVAKEMRGGVDTIFFLTDGYPTSGPSIKGVESGRRVGNNMAPNAGYSALLLEEITRWNKDRRIKINTIGIGDHDKGLMNQLARRNFGVYVAP